MEASHRWVPPTPPPPVPDDGRLGEGAGKDRCQGADTAVSPTHIRLRKQSRQETQPYSKHPNLVVAESPHTLIRNQSRKSNMCSASPHVRDGNDMEGRRRDSSGDDGLDDPSAVHVRLADEVLRGRQSIVRIDRSEMMSSLDEIRSALCGHELGGRPRRLTPRSIALLAIEEANLSPQAPHLGVGPLGVKHGGTAGRAVRASSAEGLTLSNSCGARLEWGGGMATQTGQWDDDSVRAVLHAKNDLASTLLLRLHKRLGLRPPIVQPQMLAFIGRATASCDTRTTASGQALDNPLNLGHGLAAASCHALGHPSGCERVERQAFSPGGASISPRRVGGGRSNSSPAALVGNGRRSSARAGARRCRRCHGCGEALGTGVLVFRRKQVTCRNCGNCFCSGCVGHTTLQLMHGRADQASPVCDLCHNVLLSWFGGDKVDGGGKCIHRRQRSSSTSSTGSMHVPLSPLG